MIAVSIEEMDAKETNSASEFTNVPQPIRERPINEKKIELNTTTSIKEQYDKYTICRSFQPGVYQKHINLRLISAKSTNGLIILRPYNKRSLSSLNTPSTMSSLLNRLSKEGNGGVISIPTGDAPAFLQRNIPSSTVLDNGEIITSKVNVQKGPGRPFGSCKVNESKGKGKQSKQSKHSKQSDSLQESSSKTLKKSKSESKRVFKDISDGHAKTKKQKKPKISFDDESSDEFELTPLEPDYELRPDSSTPALVNVFDINSLIQFKNSWIVF